MLPLKLGVYVVFEELISIFEYALAYLFKIDLNLISPSCCVTLKGAIKFENT